MYFVMFEMLILQTRLIMPICTVCLCNNCFLWVCLVSLFSIRIQVLFQAYYNVNAILHIVSFKGCDINNIFKRYIILMIIFYLKRGTSVYKCQDIFHTDIQNIEMSESRMFYIKYDNMSIGNKVYSCIQCYLSGCYIATYTCSITVLVNVSHQLFLVEIITTLSAYLMAPDAVGY